MKTKAILTALIVSFLGLSTISFAGNGNFRRTHPRRAEVNARLRNQNKRINKEVKEGEMSKGKAAALKANDHKIRKEEQLMASQNHGHITKAEQKVLNQQENANSRKIGK